MHKSADGAALSIDWHSGYHISLVNQSTSYHSTHTCKLRYLISDIYLLEIQDMLPEYIQMPVAQSILFAGKAVRVLRNPSSGFQLKDDSSNQNSGPKGAFFGFHGSMKDLSDEFGLVVQELLPQSEAEKIDTMLRELKV